MKLFFLLLSLLLWFLIKLSKPGYSTTIEFPIKYTNAPQNRVLSEAAPQHLQVLLQGNGFSLAKYSLFNFKRLRINLSDLKKTGTEGLYYWVPGKDEFWNDSQFGEDIRIISLEPDTLFFNYEMLIKKKLPVKPQLNLSFEDKTVQLYGTPKVEPDSIWLTGPQSLLEEIDSLSTESWNVKQSADSLERNLAILPPEAGKISLNKSEVRVKLQFSKLTEAVAEVPIVALNVPDSMELRLYPSTARVTYRSLLRDFERNSLQEILIVADFQELQDYPHSQFLTLQVRQQPEAILSLSIQPKRVEFILSPKL